MNLTEALNSALPEIPALVYEQRPRAHPNLIGKEHVEGGRRVVHALIPEKGFLYRMSPEQWELVNLFDGTRTLEEVAQLHWQRTGVRYSLEEMQDVVATLDETQFWFKSPLEQNVALKQRLTDERQRAAQSFFKYGDINDLRLWHWNPDAYLTVLYRYLKFLYTPWYAVVSLVALALTVYIFVDRWSDLGRDTLQFYNFREKTFGDIVEFWLLAALVLFVHETGHGLTCKHFGGHVHKMGFNLIYLTPAFYTDAQEIFVIGGKWERLLTVFWGIWAEMQVCFVATAVWYGTPPGSVVHDAAYKLILITGIMAVILNWNPLIKLDGYYLITEALSLPRLKEQSTAYALAWVKKRVWKLPVEIPFVPRNLRLGYFVYAFLSGAYSYTLLFYVTRFIGNIASSYSPEWGFLVALAVGYRIFRTRIRAFLRFMNTLYLDKKERLLGGFDSKRRLVVAMVLALLLLVPFWRESVEGRFVLEPLERAVVRVAVPGLVVSVHADEGQRVDMGAPLARLRNLKLETEAAQARADYDQMSARSLQLQLTYSDYAAAERERQRLAEKSRTLAEEASRLEVRSPIAGVVTTPRVRDRLGSYVEAGTELAEVSNLSTLRARIYLPEFEFRKARADAPVHLHPDSSFTVLRGKVERVAPVAREIQEGLLPESAYRGARLGSFYVFDIHLDNTNQRFRQGMTGTAKIYGRRRSLAGLLLEPVQEFVARRLW